MLNRDSINEALEEAGVPEDMHKKAGDGILRRMEQKTELKPWRFPRHPVKPEKKK